MATTNPYPTKLIILATLAILTIILSIAAANRSRASSPSPHPQISTPKAQNASDAILPPRPPPQPNHDDSNDPLTTAPIYDEGTALTIHACNNSHGNANFRSQPRFGQDIILGIVAQGDRVYLTGKTIGPWQEAIAPLIYTPNAILIHQTGWIANCWK